MILPWCCETKHRQWGWFNRSFVKLNCLASTYKGAAFACSPCISNSDQLGGFLNRKSFCLRTRVNNFGNWPTYFRVYNAEFLWEVYWKCSSLVFIVHDVLGPLDRNSTSKLHVKCYAKKNRVMELLSRIACRIYLEDSSNLYCHHSYNLWWDTTDAFWRNMLSEKMLDHMSEIDSLKRAAKRTTWRLPIIMSFWRCSEHIQSKHHSFIKQSYSCILNSRRNQCCQSSSGSTWRLIAIHEEKQLKKQASIWDQVFSSYN